MVGVQTEMGLGCRASRVAQWSRALQRSASGSVGSCPGSVGRDREVRGATHNWPSVVRVREGLASRDILISSRTSDTCGGPGAVHANQGCQVHGVPSGKLVRLASSLDARCVKKQYGWLGCVSEDA